MAIFASGSGSNAEEIVKYFTNHPGIKVQVIATNNPKAMVVDRAKRLGVATKIFTREEFFSNAIADWLRENHITHIVLAGFLWLIPPSILNAYPGKIINIHPALLPKFGGKGMYGMKIHELVRSLKEKETGITIHLINERYDEGPILYQGKCEVLDTDTAEQIAHKVHQLEYAWYPKIIEQWVLTDADS